MTKSLLNIFKERAQMEEEYSKKLLKLAKGLTPFEEVGTMKETLCVLKAELETSARMHTSVANEIKSQLEVPCIEFIKLQSGVRKNFESIIDRQLKMKSATYTAANKAREKYISKCQEVNHLMFQKPGLPPADLEKVKAKVKKCQEQAKHYDIEYLSLVEQHNEIQKTWQEDFAITCRECQKLEEERFEFFYTRLWTYANIMSSVCVSNDESYERLRVSLESCDLQKDLNILIESCSTGSSPPAPLQYVNFYTGSSLRPLDALPFKRVDSAKSHIHSISEYRPQLQTTEVVTEPKQELESNNTSIGKWAVNSIAGFFGLHKTQEPNSNQSRSGQNLSDAVEEKESRVEAVICSSPENCSEDDQQLFEYDPFDVPEHIQVLFQVMVTHNYTAERFEELTIHAGQILPVIATYEDGWNEAVVTDNGLLRKGFYPSNFTEELQ
ncbi:hypothetical protein HDU79_001677 [Rhizoclosmatium sp. JEL0117]|nr:hypothetical protein HDU79_001677 [Rhizoclosmatium sp. JEL0117]